MELTPLLLSLVALTALTALTNCQTLLRTVVQGRSRNVVIVCDLPQSFSSTLYWNINGLVYDRDSVPDIFNINRRNELIIPTIKGGMHGWRFQCFTIYPYYIHGMNLGLSTVLRVIRISDIPDESIALQPSTRGRVIFHYQQVQIDPGDVILTWLYNGSSSCTFPIKYKVAFYTRSDVMSMSSQDELNPSFNNITSSTFFHERNLAFDQAYSSVAAMTDNNDECATTNYLLNIQESVNTTYQYSNGSSAQFRIPNDLLDASSLQLVWSQNDSTQCTCPPVEDIITQCACNKDNTDNFISISNNILSIVNLRNDLMLYFINSSYGCQGNCNIRSIASVFNISYQGLSQESPTSDDLCGYYQVRLTNTTSRSTDVTLKCRIQQPSLALTIYQDNLPQSPQSFVMACNSTMKLSTLEPETKYTISYNMSCLLGTFRTADSSSEPAFTSTSIIVALSFAVFGIIPLLIILVCIFCMKHGYCCCYRATHAVVYKDKTDEIYTETNPEELVEKL